MGSSSHMNLMNSTGTPSLSENFCLIPASVSLPSLLAGRARLFASEGQAARDDPSGTFALSKPVDSLSFFLSHSWRTSRVAKYCALQVEVDA